MTRLLTRASPTMVILILALLALGPQTIFYWGRGDDWVGLFLLDGLPSFETRLNFMLNAPWIGGRPVSAFLSAGLYEVVNPNYSNLWLFRTFNLFVGATWMAGTYSVCRRVGLGKSLATPIAVVPITLPGMYFWASSSGSFVYLFGALVAQIAGLFLVSPKRSGFIAALSGALFSVFCYQPALALVFLAPSIYAATTRSARERRRVMWRALLIYLLALGSNFITVLLTGGNYRLVRPSVFEMLRSFVVELLPRSVVPWLQVFNINQYVLSGIAILIVGSGAKLWKSKSHHDLQESSGETRISKSLDRLLEFATSTGLVLITVCPLVFTKSVEGTRVTFFSSVVYWSIFLVVLKKPHITEPDQKSIGFRLEGLGLVALTVTAAVFSAGLYFYTTIRPAVKEWTCMSEASQIASYPPSLPIGLGVKSPTWIRETEEMGESSLALENPTRFQILYSFKWIGKDPQLEEFIWDVPVDRQSPNDAWTQKFVSCIESRAQS